MPLNKAELDAQLTQSLAQIDPTDTEQILNALREFKQAQSLHVAAADISGALPLMRVSDNLTDLAEVVLQHCVNVASYEMGQRYGVPRCKAADGPSRQVAFAVLAYGKLGGIELGYSSDLDLVFVHDSEGDAQQTDGEKSIDNSLYFIRRSSFG